MPNFKLLGALLLLIEVALTAVTGTFTVAITPMDDTTSAIATYSLQILTIVDSGFVPRDSIYTVTFPTDYSVAGLSGVSGARTDGSPNTITLSLLARTFTLLGDFPDDLFDMSNMQYALTGVINPNRAITTQPFVVSLVSGSTVLFSDSSVTVSITPGTLTCSMVPDITQVQAVSAYTVTITPSTPIPATGQLQMTFPNNWKNDQVQNTTVLNTGMYCSPGTNTSSGISCPRNGLVVNVTNLFSAATSSQFQFKIQLITNPSTEEPMGPIEIVSTDSSFKQIDKCSAMVTGVTAATLSQVTFFTNLSSLSSSSVGTLQFTTSQTLQTNDQLKVVFPAAFKLSQFTSCFMFVNGIKSAKIQSLSGNTVLVSIPNITSLSAAVIKYTFNNVTAPPSTLTTEPLVVQTIRSGYAIEGVSCCSYTATAGTLTANVTASSYLAGNTVDYTFVLTTSNPLTVSASVTVTFPSQYALAASTQTCLSAIGTNVSTTPTCTISAPRTLTISNLLTSSLLGGSTMTVKAGSILNPSQALTTSNFVITTIYSSGGGSVDINNNQSVNITPSAITSVGVLTSNVITNQPANYTFTIQNTNVLAAGSFLQVQIPADLTVGSLSCMVNNSISVLCLNISTYVVNITNLINSSVAIGALKNSPITIMGLTNPITFKPTASFSITIYTSAFVSIETLTTGITVTMSTAATFSSNSLNITPSSMLTGQNTTYLVELAAPFALSNNTFLQMLFPSEYQISSLLCSNVSNLQTLNCGSTTVPISTTLPLSVGGVSSVKLRVGTITNPLSQATISLITVDLFIGGFKSLESTVRLGPFTPNVVSYSMNETSSFMNESTSLTLLITTTNMVPPNGYLTSAGYLAITMPSEYNTSSMTCSSVVGVTSFSCTNASNIIKIAGSSYQTAITVVIAGLLNPSLASSSIFSISTYDSNNNAVDSSTANSKYSVPCTLPCRSCTATPTSCLSCYTATGLQSVVSNQKYLSQYTCVLACNSSAYSDSNFICYACSSNCLTCSVAAANCTSCPVAAQYMQSNVCYATCPSGSYPDNPTNTCKTCINSCLTCSTAAVCITCISNYYLNGTSCLLTCPPLYYSSSFVCFPCDANCMSCDSTGCLTCASTYLLYAGICYLQCPAGVFISGSSCAACSSSCFTCITYSNVCGSCLTTGTLLYLYSGSCLASCPVGYYSDNAICTRCVSPCDQCSTLVTCTKCVSGQLLYNASCSYTSCPGNTIQIGVDCFDCTSPCLTCSVGVTHCTSCIAGEFLNNSQCVPTCTSPYFGINGVCVACATPCSTCVTLQPYNCTACVSNYYLLGAVCYSNCPSGTYTAFAQGKCNTCATGCLTCNNATNCTSCNSGLFLFNFYCYSTCPTVPVYYFAYQSLCLTCQPQCTSCLQSPIMCSSCSSSLYLHNTITMTCLLACQSGYYQNGTKCVPCQLPCKTCDTVYDSCATCYNGHFLYAGNCTPSCPSGYFNQDSNNTCVQCVFPCLQCTNATCLICDVSAAYFNTSCYINCPAAAPYNVNGFCTNCTQLDWCLTCLNGQCVVCISPYLLYLGRCIKTCPENYEPDVGGSSCTETGAYLTYLNSVEMDRRKNLPFPFVIVLLCFALTLLVGKCQNRKIYHLGALIAVGGLLQLFSWALFLAFLLVYGSTLTWLPYLAAALLAVNLLFNGLNLIPIFNIYRPDSAYTQWLSHGNSNKEKVVLAVSFLTSYKVTRCLFSRYYDLPIFCSRLLGVDKFYWWNRLTCVSLLFVQGLAIAVAILAAYNEPLYYTKVFLSSIEVVFFSLFETVLQLADLRKDEHNFFKEPEEDPLKDTSKNRLHGYSEWGAQEVDDKNKFSRTRSEGDIEPQEKNLYQILDDDYISVFDPSDYQEVPKVPNTKIPRAIEKGKFRKKNKKKLVDLWSIAQISSDNSEDNNKKKPRGGGKQKGFINNYLYWKPPVAKKVQVKPKPSADLSEFDQERIFETIRNKQSQFDLLSKHEDLYVERNAQKTRYSRYLELQQPEESKMSIDVSASEEPLGDFNNPNNFTFTLDPDDLMNLNYARKKHMEKKRQEPPPASDTRRPFSRVGGMILKNTKH